MKWWAYSHNKVANVWHWIECTAAGAESLKSKGLIVRQSKGKPRNPPRPETEKRFDPPDYFYK